MGFKWNVQELQTGLNVASGEAPTLDEAKREAGHYAIQYAQDGPVQMLIREDRRIIQTVTIDLTP